MNKILETENNKLIYKDYKYIYETINNNYLLIELERVKLYNKFILYFKKIYNKIINKYKNINLNDKNIFPQEALLLDLISTLILNMKNNNNILFDSFFDKESPFEKIKLQNYFFKKNCILTLSNDLIKWCIKILSKLSKKYIKYYNKLYNTIKYLNNEYSIKLNYLIDFEIIDNNKCIIINLKKDNNIIHYIKLPYHIFSHLIKLYNNTIYNEYNNDTIKDNIVIEYIYMIFIRYNSISNGNNQSSILPSFKKLIKDKLNIKIELFGSALNTSMYKFGSVFYDIEKVFGSIGNYFDTNIIKGYYEINPIFDKCLIDNIFIKCDSELTNAENNKYGLLFLLILPASYFKLSNINLFTNNYGNLPSNIHKFIKYKKILSKENFPYIRYNRYMTKTIVSSIVKTNIIICHTSFISDYVSKNVLIFDSLLNNWIKKK
jgi:hypothetical protein